jgi:hypothetical protein
MNRQDAVRTATLARNPIHIDLDGTTGGRARRTE